MYEDNIGCCHILSYLSVYFFEGTAPNEVPYMIQFPLPGWFLKQHDHNRDGLMARIRLVMLLLGINTPKPFMTVAVGQFCLKLFCLSSGPTDDAVEDFGTFIALIPAGEMENVHCPDDRISTKQAEWFPKAFCRCSYRPLLGDYYTFSCSMVAFIFKYL